MQTVKSILIIGFIVAFFLACLVSYAEDVPEGIIFVDQSGSVKKHDPRLKSRALLTVFLRTFKKPYRIVLAGFNEEIHEYASVVTETETNIDALAGEIQKIDAHSYCTDLEIPFRYLLERDGKGAIEFALIISDGEPDIWDGKLRHFSKRVKSDSRYEDLNKQYRMLKASGLSPDELFDRLRHLYHERNLELIEEQLSRLGDGLGDRIILWDLSGESGYLRGLAEKCGAQYLPMKTEQKVTLVDLLRLATSRSSRTFHEPPPQDRETGLESALPAYIEPKPETGLEQRQEKGHTIVAPRLPSPELGDEPKKPAELTRKRISGEGVAGWTITVAVALFVLISGGGIIMLSRFRKKALQTEVAKLNSSELLQHVKLNIEDHQQRLGDIVSASIKEASKYIDDEIRRAMREAEELWDHLTEEGAKAPEFDKRFSIRTPVPPGAMEVHWTNEDGTKMRGQAVNISMDAVLFEAPGFRAESIDRVVCPRLDVVLNVKRSRIHREDEDRVVAVLEEFEGNVDDSMRWVEILTSIDEREEE